MLRFLFSVFNSRQTTTPRACSFGLLQAQMKKAAKAAAKKAAKEVAAAGNMLYLEKGNDVVAEQM